MWLLVLRSLFYVMCWLLTCGYFDYQLSEEFLIFMRSKKGESKLTLEQMHQQQLIRYITFPEQLKGKYQSFTQANIEALRKVGYAQTFYSVDEGTTRYVNYLLSRVA